MRQRPARDGGFTLAELMVVIGLLMIVGVIAVSALFTAFRSTARIADSTDTAAKLQLAAERVARELRVADPIVAGSARAKSIQVRIFRNGRCDRVTYQVVNNQLVQYMQRNLTPSPNPTGLSPGTACTTPAAVLPTHPPTTTLPRVVYVSNLDPAVTKVFTYYDATGAEITESQLVANAGLTTEIREIRLTLRRVRAGKSTLQVITSIKLRNVKVAP